ncbi:MAG: drug/metabolite exporter YedA [Cyanobacteriota bacterium]|nr:drug/metabolite exporter YedA [Cyanobacteriota bacterium]
MARGTVQKDGGQEGDPVYHTGIMDTKSPLLTAPVTRTEPPLPHRPTVIFCLIVLYFIWGSTYLAIAIATHDFPPFTLMGLRFMVAGSLLYGWSRWQGSPSPTLPQWGSSLLVGSLLLALGNGGLAYAEQWVDTGLASLIIATTSLWAALFARLWGDPTSRREWLGMAIGLLGVGFLNLEGNLQANPGGALLLIGCAMSWALGSVWSRHLPLPGGMMSSAAQMLGGSLVLLLIGGLRGERLTHFPTGIPLLAMVYLIIFGSLVGYSAYTYLLRHVRTSLATSYSYVNPVVAVMLGIALAGEQLSSMGWLGMLVILSGVVLVVFKANPDH